MLNAELKSMNSRLTYEFLMSRWIRAGRRAEVIASSWIHNLGMQTGRGPRWRGGWL